MTPEALHTLSIVLAVTGLGFFLWPVVQRIRGRAPVSDDPLSNLTMVRSRIWWVGFGLTLAALIVQRMAAGSP